MLSRTLPRFLSQPKLTCTRTVVFLSTNKNATPQICNASSRHSTYLLQKPRFCRQAFGTPAPHINDSDLPMDRYHALADATMISLLERLEDILDETADKGFEVDYHGGVLTLNLGPNGTYVINKQPPNKQIWLSSPVSGPKRYDYAPPTDDWRYSRDGEQMSVLLERELSRALGREVNLGLGHVSEVV